MRFVTLCLVLGVLGCSGACSSSPRAAQRDDEALVLVRFLTTAGEIDVELDRGHAPIGVANFLKYAERGDYNGTIFHRCVPNFVVQGGGYTLGVKEMKGEAPIKNEWGNGLLNARGTIGWARDADPDTATREFFFNVRDNVKLDTARPNTGNAGYAVFGRVVKGMELIDAMAVCRTYAIPERDMKDVPVAPVVVNRVERAGEE